MSTSISAQTTFLDPFTVDYDLAAGVMRNPTNHLVRHASDMRGHYRDNAAFEALVTDGNPVHYEVFERPVPNEYGHLMFCISDLKAGCVGDECFMTKGHYHTASRNTRTSSPRRISAVSLVKASIAR
jgi:glucose-6-phosphate isomerase